MANSIITKIELVENMLKIGNYLKLFRVNFNGLRLYISENPFSYYSGLTGALSAAAFSGDKDKRRLSSWRNDFIDSYGKKAADDYLQMTADFGTLLHSALVTIKEKGQINWNEEQDNAHEYFVQAYREKFLEPDVKVIKSMVYEYQKHVASLMQFHYDCVQEIYAIETPAIWEGLKIATPIDEVCLCRQTPKGEFKPTTINLKTSSQISKSQFEQIACEMVMWNHTYEDKVEYTAILRTKDWTEGKTPTYKYKYLPKEEAEKLALNCEKRLLLCLQSEASYFPEPTHKKFTGITKIGEMPIITVTSIQEEWDMNEKLK
jgi:hypothetical protein